ncbi:MAG: acyl-CoA carboxylase epsilon subunit [Acidimicrobiia bacterium]
MSQPGLRAIAGNAMPEEVAAIVAVVTALEAERQAALAAAAAPFASSAAQNAWVDVARRTARGVPTMRGSWRLASRTPRRFR